MKKIEKDPPSRYKHGKLRRRGHEFAHIDQVFHDWFRMWRFEHRFTLKGTKISLKASECHLTQKAKQLHPATLGGFSFLLFRSDSECLGGGRVTRSEA